MSNLFSPLIIRSVTLKNRLVVSPMCQYSSQDGFSNDWHLVHLGSRAVGGASVVFTEATAVTPKGRISPFDLGIWKDDHIAGLKRITEFITQQKAIPGIQLAHAGRKASHSEPWKGNRLLQIQEGGWKTIAPSSIPFSRETDTPEALSIEEISKTIDDFKSAALRSFQSGFKIIEIHGAHGYLINEFLSPLSNKRTDKYGGSFENRIRMLLEIVTAVRTVWPMELPLFVRLSATDWLQDGWSVEDSIKLADQLKHLGVDLVDCSSGGIVPDISIPLSPGYQVHLAEQIRKKSGIMTGAVGLITQAKQAEEIINKQQADIILMAREFLRDPYFPLHAAHELDSDIDWPVQYTRAKLKTK